MSDSVWPHRWKPTRLCHPWDSPGKNTGVSCHFLLQCMKVKSEREVAQSCPTLSNPMDCSLPGSSVRGIFQARVLEWGAIAFSVEILRYTQKNLEKFNCLYLNKAETVKTKNNNKKNQVKQKQWHHQCPWRGNVKILHNFLLVLPL